MRAVLVACAALSACASPDAAPAAAIACVAERAVYSLPESDAELRLIKTPHSVNAFSDLTVRVTADEQVFWFAFVNSNGYGRSFLGYIADPTAPDAEDPLEIEDAQGDNDLGLFDTQMNYLDTPQSGDPAPHYLYAPGIGVRFWYDASNRTLIPIGMWRLTSCAPA